MTPGIGDVVTDPGLLRQIVVNLLSNALDAVDLNGRVDVEARPVADDDILITVSDTGHGIPPDDLRRIFEPFYTTKGRGKGTGLGLAICRQLTAALGGTISVESESGKGSTFFVRLPRQGPPVAESRPPRAREAGVSVDAGADDPTTRVLVAEDDRVARDLLCEILRGEGYEVEAVDDGAGAVERAQEGRYDLVVSDVRMERSGGLDVLAAFTSKAPSTPVILITAFGDVDRRDGGDPAGRVRLRLEAVQRRGAAPDGGARAGAQAAGRRAEGRALARARRTCRTSWARAR